jgi:DNA polymerase I-like protein with 3'-5' exonuclease and polymerase domains
VSLCGFDYIWVSAFGLSNQTNLSRKESADLIEAYYQSYPRLKSYIQEQIEFARENGYVQTILGRRRYLKDINSQMQWCVAVRSEMQSTPYTRKCG